jgi:hypothetical protein
MRRLHSLSVVAVAVAVAPPFIYNSLTCVLSESFFSTRKYHFESVGQVFGISLQLDRCMHANATGTMQKCRIISSQKTLDEQPQISSRMKKNREEFNLRLSRLEK